MAKQRIGTFFLSRTDRQVPCRTDPSGFDQYRTGTRSRSTLQVVIQGGRSRNRTPPRSASIHGRIDYNHRPRQCPRKRAMTHELSGRPPCTPLRGQSSWLHSPCRFRTGLHALRKTLPPRRTLRCSVGHFPSHRSPNAPSARRSCTSESPWTNAPTQRPLFVSFSVSKATCPNLGDGAWS